MNLKLAPQMLPRLHLLRSLHNSTTTTPASPTKLAHIILTSPNSQTLAQTLHSDTIHWTPQLVNSVLKKLWNHGPKALQFFQVLIDHPHYLHHQSSFDHAVDIAARLKNHCVLWHLVSLMRSNRIGPSPRTFAIIAERFVSAGKPDRAIRVFLSMHEYGCFQDLNCFNTILDVLCKSRRVELAYRLFRDLNGRFKPDCVTYNVIANGWCLIKRTNKALEVLKEMVEKGLKPNLISYNTLLKGYFRAGQINEGWDYFLEMKRRGVEIDVVSYTTVIHGFGVAGEVNRARNVFEQMVEDGVLPSVATYNALIQVLCKKDSAENAILVFKEMVKMGYAPNSVTYNLVIRGLCHAGEMDRAMVLTEKMKDDECGPNVQTYNLLIRYFCQAGEIEKGLDVFQKMGSGDCFPNLDTYNIIISAMFVRKRSDDLVVAGKMFVEMVDRGFLPRKFTFNRILNGLLVTGNQEFAKEILRLKSKCGGLPRRFKL